MKKKLIVVLASAGLSIVAIGCGKASDTQGVGYVPGSVSFCPSGLSCSDTASACAQSNGWLVAPKTCRFQVYSSVIGTLNSTDPRGPNAQQLMQIRKGDQISIPAVSGSWGTVSSGSWGIIQWYNGFNCTSKYDLTGKSLSDGTVATYAGLPEGLVGSDGTEVFMIGNSISNKVVNNFGVLRLGINAPPTSALCGSLSPDNYLYVDITTQ